MASLPEGGWSTEGSERNAASRQSQMQSVREFPHFAAERPRESCRSAGRTGITEDAAPSGFKLSRWPLTHIHHTAAQGRNQRAQELNSMFTSSLGVQGI